MRLQSGIDLGTVEADDDVAADVEHRDAHLVGFVDSLLHILLFALDIAIVVFDPEFVEIILGGVAKCTPTSAVDYDGIVHAFIVSQKHYTL